MKIKRIAAILAVACIVVAPMWAIAARPAQTGPGADERELLKACRARLLALNHFDVATIDRYTHGDYIGTADTGGRLSKSDLLKSYAPHSSEPPNSYGEMQDVQVRIYGATGILNYRIELRERFGDRDIVSQLRRTDVFLKQDGRWQDVSAQLTPIPVNHLSPVAADAATYDDFVGEYELNTDNVDRVTHEGDKLFGATAAVKGELLPLGNDKFFYRDETGQLTFTRDTAGKVTGYSYQLCDGQQILARKVR